MAVSKQPKSKCRAKVVYKNPCRLAVKLNSKLTLILGQLNLALNNRALGRET